jgi:hypothetical protein
MATGGRPASRATAAFAAGLCIMMVVPPTTTAAAPQPAASDMSGDGHVEDAVGFGLFGVEVEVTVWASSGIAAGPSTLTAGAGGNYSWAFAQVPDSSLMNLTLRAVAPWDPNLTAEMVFDLTNASAPFDFPGVVLALPFVANEGVSLVAPTGAVSVPRGRNATVAVEVEVVGNTTVAHEGPSVSSATGDLSATILGSPGPDAKAPGERFRYDISLAATGAAAPQNTTVTLTLPSTSGADLTVALPVRVVLNREVAVRSIATSPAPPQEAKPALILVEVANNGADFATAATVLVRAHNATEPALYANTTSVDLPPGGAAVVVSFGWTPPWSPTPVSLFASVFVPNDWDSDNDTLNGSVDIESTNAGPTVALSSPPDGTRAEGNITVTGTASDPEGGPLAVAFSVDGGPPFHNTTGTAFGFVWDIGALPDGPHVLTATARDDRGNQTSASASVVVLNRGPNAPPTVAVSTPEGGDTVPGGVWVNGTASDERDELAAVFVSVDGGPEATATGLSNWSFFWNASAVGQGPHTLRVEAFDGIDRSAPRTVNVTVNLTPATSIEFVGVVVSPAIVQPNGAMRVNGTLRFDTGVLAEGVEVSGNLRGFAAVAANSSAARGQFTLDLPAPSAEGNYTLDLNARFGSVLGNASLTVRVARGNAPDLEVAPGALRVAPDPPIANQPVQHTVDIRNLGPVTGHGTLRVWDETGGAPLLIHEEAFDVTSQRQASFVHSYFAGLHNLTVRIEGVTPPDVDLSNNELRVSLRVLSLPDFAVLSLTASRTDPEEGQNVSFLAVIRNVGEAGGTVTFELWDGAPAGANSTRFYFQAVALLPGDVERVVASWTSIAGEHDIHAALVLSAPEEHNLTNNVRHVEVHVTGKPAPEPPVFLPGLGGAAAAAGLGAAAAARRGGKREGPPRGRTGIAVVVVLAVALAVAATPSPAGARLEDAGLIPGPLTGVCQTCHTDPNGGPGLNAFGRDFAKEANATGGPVDLERLAALDSDGDGYGNEAEWSDGYLPGDAASNPTTGVRYSGFSGSGVTSAAAATLALIALSLFGGWLGYTMLKRRNTRLAARAAARSDDGDDGPGH